MAQRVIFLTTVFDNVANGPALYAQYLWNAFRVDPEFEFHVVAPTTREEHPRLHASGLGRSSRDLYNRACRLAVKLATEGGTNTILHSNGAHLLEAIGNYRGILLAHINDYQVADVWQDPIGVLRRFGPRNLVAQIWKNRQEARISHLATKIICNSEYTRKRILESYSCAPDKVLMINKGINTADFTRPSVLPTDPFPNRPFGARLVVIGSNWRLKGVPELIAALASIRRDVPNVHLTVGGPSRPVDLAKLQALARRYGVSGQVAFPGLIRREQLPAMLWHSDVFVMPTRKEALGVAIIEAMAAGTPVIASRVGGIPEVIRNENEGVLIPMANITELADAVIGLLTDNKKRNMLAHAGPSRAGEFGVEKMIGKVRELYISLNSMMNRH